MADLVLDKSFDINNTSEYNLSIQVNLDGFSFIITDSRYEKLIAFKNEMLKISNEGFLARRLVERINSQHLLGKNFNQVKVLFHTNKFTLIPETYYDEEKNTEIFNLLLGTIENHFLKVTTLSKISAKLIFSIPNDLGSELSKIYQNFSFLHPVELLLQNLTEDDSLESKILMLINSNNFFILIFKNNSLLVANSYQYLHFNDILYFILSNLSHCQIDQNNTKLFLTSSMTNEKQKDIATELKKYLGSVEILKPTLISNNEIVESSSQSNSLFLIK